MMLVPVSFEQMTWFLLLQSCASIFESLHEALACILITFDLQSTTGPSPSSELHDIIITRWHHKRFGVHTTLSTRILLWTVFPLLEYFRAKCWYSLLNRAPEHTAQARVFLRRDCFFSTGGQQQRTLQTGRFYWEVSEKWQHLEIQFETDFFP